MNEGWYGFDLDGTLAHYDEWVNEFHIGEPIPKMVEEVQRLLARGDKVKIFTARVYNGDGRDISAVINNIKYWCELHIGQSLDVTCTKDYGMIALYDDRAIQVVPNTGERVDGK
jgi:hypothetical protein